MSHHKKHNSAKRVNFLEKILHKKKQASKKELQEQNEAFGKILFEERRQELEEIKKHEELKKKIESKRHKRKEKIREMLDGASIFLQNLTIPKTNGKSFAECYANLDNAIIAISKNDISKARKLYIEARRTYIDLSYEEKKKIYKELLQLYKQLAV